MNYRRNEKRSRETILKRLRTYPKNAWVRCADVLGQCGLGGPWSEDLQALVVEGVLESHVSIEQMGMKTFVRMK